MNEKLTFEQKVYAFAKEFRPSDKEIEEFKQFLNNDTQKEFIFKGRGVALIIKDKNDSLSVLRGNAYIDPLLLQEVICRIVLIVERNCLRCYHIFTYTSMCFRI